MDIRICTHCGKEIKDSYFKCTDKFLEEKYFDNPEESNCFCSKECFAEALFLEEVKV